MSDKEFIKNFLNIKLTRICKELHLESDIKNVYNLTASKDKLKEVRDLIEKKIEELYEEE